MDRRCSLSKRRCATPGAALLVALACAVIGCRARPAIHVVPVDASASDALYAAQDALRSSDPSSRSRAYELAERAHAIEPDWVAATRFLDELSRDDLRGVEALQEHRSHISELESGASSPARKAALAGELYLAGRLEGLDGKDRFERAVVVDPDLAWGHHGLSWAASVTGKAREAVDHARAALARARDPWERAFFASSLARALVAADARDEALKLLEARIAADDARPSDRDSLEVQAVEIGLETLTLRVRMHSYERALALLRERELSEAEVDELVTKLRLSPSPDDPDLLELQSSLAVRTSPARDRLRAELMLDGGSTPLALGLLERALTEQKRVAPAGPLMRAARFAAGQEREAVERWLAALPSHVLASDGLPVEPALRRVVECTRRLGAASGAPSPSGASDGDARHDALVELGEALVAAGWFREARSLAGELAARDLDRALSIESRAVAGQDLIEGLRRLVRKVDLEQGAGATAAQAGVESYRIAKDGESGKHFDVLGEHTGIRDLSGLLAAMGPLFARAHVFLGGDVDPDRVSNELVRSPRMSYGPIGELCHPGPRFSRDDQREDLGRAGECVPGLASELARIGRFGLFGEVSGGGGPDGTLLPRILVEQKSGMHLGVPWSGTAVWCESAELKSRAGRRGAQISAAALHEGYWLDVDGVRAEQALWNALRREFGSAEKRERIDNVLAVRGLELEAGDDEHRSRERTRTGFLLGEAQRVRLALLVERGTKSANGMLELGDIGLDELIQVTATHEEGHLCDRTRFLPISHHLGPVFLLLLDCGFSPKKVAEVLEYRAQLTSLCDSPDPRVPLAQVLDAAELGLGGVTPHGLGYTSLLSDFLDVFDAELARHPQDFPRIDPGYTLAHQLHRLGADDVRRIAMKLAHKKRLPS
jgi:tetratricopeptide (TPR) repeat protein